MRREGDISKKNRNRKIAAGAGLFLAGVAAIDHFSQPKQATGDHISETASDNRSTTPPSKETPKEHLRSASDDQTAIPETIDNVSTDVKKAETADPADIEKRRDMIFGLQYNIPSHVSRLSLEPTQLSRDFLKLRTRLTGHPSVYITATEAGLYEIVSNGKNQEGITTTTTLNAFDSPGEVGDFLWDFKDKQADILERYKNNADEESPEANQELLNFIEQYEPKPQEEE